MSLSIFVLESSIVDFAGAVVAVAPDGTGVVFDGPHLHMATDREGSRRSAKAKRTFFVGSGAPEFGQTLAEIRRILRSIAVPISSSKPIVNSDGITIRQFMVYKSGKVDILIPKVFSGLALGTPDGLVCEHGTHLAMRTLGYAHCPVDGSSMAAPAKLGIFETLLKEKFRISEVRVEDPPACKRCPSCAGNAYPNAFGFCPRCGGKLEVKAPEKDRPS